MNTKSIKNFTMKNKNYIKCIKNHYCLINFDEEMAIS